jgi:hypothetical protein
MAGKHRRGAAHRPAVPTRAPRHIGIVDARSHVQHLMTHEVAAAHRHAGSYLALCGAQVLAASLTTPERRRCVLCRPAR